MHDLILRHGTIIDGTGSPRFEADIAIRDGLIAEIGDLSSLSAPKEIDASGHVVAPGFIDVHNHSDGWLLRKTNFTPKTLQGFTTEVLMADGIGYAPLNDLTAREWLFYLRGLNGLRYGDYEGWQTYAEYMQTYNRRSAQHAASHLPYANLRSLVAGFRRGPLDDAQLREIRRQVCVGMEAGAVGLSTGLDYISQCFSSTDELVDACRAMAPYDGLYVTHMRYKSGLFTALDEVVEIGQRAGVRIHISHLKGGSADEVEQVLAYVDRVRKSVDISYDVYPYLPGSTMLNFLFPYEIWEEGPLAAQGRVAAPALRERVATELQAYRLPLDEIRFAWMPTTDNAHLLGKSLQHYITESGRPAVDALTDLLIEERFAPILVFGEADDSVIEPMLTHDLYMMGTDGIFAEQGPVHPRVYGSVGRLLGSLARDKQLMPLERAVQLMTGTPAERFRLRGRGTLAVGQAADVVVFDPLTVAEKATYENPHQPTIGIRDLFVEGEAVVRDGAPIESANPPGRYLAAQS